MLPLESMADGSERFGILQAFSSWPNAFSDRDVNTLQVLARRVVENVVENKRQAKAGTLAAGVASTVPSVVPSVERAVAGQAPDIESSLGSTAGVDQPLQPVEHGDSAKQAAPADIEVRSSSETPDTSVSTSVWTSVLGLVVIVLALVLGLAMGWRAGLGRGLRGAQATTASGVSANQGSDLAGRQEAESTVSDELTLGRESGQPPKAASVESAVEPPSGGLLVTENGRVIYRLPAARNGVGTGAAAKKSEASGTRLIHRVEPEYPATASAKNIQGVVTLEVQIGIDGAVHNITVVNGEAQLADAAVQAVRQWRYQPYRVNGHAVEMESRVTIRFKLPGS
jgi:TonB family protein